MLVLPASCFTLRLCVRIPLEGRLRLVLTGVVSIELLLVTLSVTWLFGFVLRPELVSFLFGLGTCISIFNLKHGEESI